LESKGVNTQYVRVIPEKYTASFFANTDLANNQIASFYSGAMVDAADLSLKDLGCDVSSLVVISPNDPRAMQKYVRECHEMGLKYLYDPSQQVVRSPGEELKEGVQGAYCLFVNEYEFELLQKHTGMSADQIRQSVNFMVVTCGEKGALVYADKTYQIPVVVPERILDPTGVGDAFRSGFLRGMQMGFDWQTCGQMGALAAAYCLEQRGTQVHHYTPAEFITRYRFHFDDQGALDTLLAKS
jgi:adenosine kinase